jgi:hypothetical protein
MTPILFWPLLVLACGYALLRGGRHERTVAIVCILATLVSMNVHPAHGRYAQVDWGELTVDFAVLAAFVAVALQSDRFWPLWLAGFQLTSSFAHIFKAVDSDLIPHAYAAAVRFWSYPMLLVLLFGTWRAHRRRTREAAEPRPA